MNLTPIQAAAPVPYSVRAPLLGRRSVLRGALLGGTLAIAATQAACSSGSSESTGPANGAADSGSSDPRNSADPSEPSTDSTGRTSPKVLLVYFSRAGENYYYGDRIDLEVGNTEVLSRTIGRQLRSVGVEHDVYRIEAADPYPEDYEETVARNVREQESDARPGIANPLESIDDYDVILIGSPIWNVRPPMIMHTFAEGHDFTGKTVYPFTTHAMSGLRTAERDYTTTCTGARIGEGLAVQGEAVRNDGPPAVSDWLTGIGLASSALRHPMAP